MCVVALWLYYQNRQNPEIDSFHLFIHQAQTNNNYSYKRNMTKSVALSILLLLFFLLENLIIENHTANTAAQPNGTNFIYFLCTQIDEDGWKDEYIHHNVNNFSVFSAPPPPSSLALFPYLLVFGSFRLVWFHLNRVLMLQIALILFLVPRC